MTFKDDWLLWLLWMFVSTLFAFHKLSWILTIGFFFSGVAMSFISIVEKMYYETEN